MKGDIKAKIEEIKENTRKEAENMLQDARLKVIKIREEGQKEIQRLKDMASKEISAVKSSFIHTRIEPGLARKLHERTKELNVSTSDFVRGLIEQALKTPVKKSKAKGKTSKTGKSKK